MFNKKAISPLIATVLVIGFTIVLAALVIQWGGQLVDKIKSETEVTSDLSLICSSGLTNLKVLEAKINPSLSSQYFVTIDNKNEQVIEGFMFRQYDNTPGTEEVKTVEKKETDDKLEAFGVKKYTVGITLTTAANLAETGVMPYVKVGTETKLCSGKELKVTVEQPAA